MLFADPETMRYYKGGSRNPGQILYHRIPDTWKPRWTHNDPTGTFYVRTKDGVFIGHVILGKGHKPGNAEVSFLFSNKSWVWEHWLPAEALGALINMWIPTVLHAAKTGSLPFTGATFGLSAPKHDGDVAPLSSVTTGICQRNARYVVLLACNEFVLDESGEFQPGEGRANYKLGHFPQNEVDIELNGRFLGQHEKND
jgi:hypothetical protein